MQESDIHHVQHLFHVGVWSEYKTAGAYMKESTLSVKLRSAGYVVGRYFEQQPVYSLALPLRGVELRLCDVQVAEGIWDSSRLDAHVICPDGTVGNVSRRVFTFNEDGMLRLPQLQDPQSEHEYRQQLLRNYHAHMRIIQWLLREQDSISDEVVMMSQNE